MQKLMHDLPEKQLTVTIGRDGRYATSITMRSNDVVLATLAPASR